VSDQQWYVTACIDCGKPLKSHGEPPAQPICLHCDIIRFAPEEIRERIRETLRPLPEPEVPPVEQFV
jgi:hypothetical protein